MNKLSKIFILILLTIGTGIFANIVLQTFPSDIVSGSEIDATDLNNRFNILKNNIDEVVNEYNIVLSENTTLTNQVSTLQSIIDNSSSGPSSCSDLSVSTDIFGGDIFGVELNSACSKNDCFKSTSGLCANDCGIDSLGLDGYTCQVDPYSGYQLSSSVTLSNFVLAAKNGTLNNNSLSQPDLNTTISIDGVSPEIHGYSRILHIYDHSNGSCLIKMQNSSGSNANFYVKDSNNNIDYNYPDCDFLATELGLTKNFVDYLWH